MTAGPIRTCISCRGKFAQSDLVRVSWSPAEGQLKVGGGSGRGAYVCPNAACRSKIFEKDRLARALKTPITDALKAQVHREFDQTER